MEETVTPYDVVKTTTTSYPDGRKVTIHEPLPAGTKVSKRIKQNVEQNLGGSWKDTARTYAAALGSFQAVQYAGIAVFLLGGASFFNVFLLKLVGGKDGAMVIAGCGLVMIFGPYLFVTYSKWFFLAILVFGIYWILARFKYQHGKLDAIESKNQPEQPK